MTTFRRFLLLWIDSLSDGDLLELRFALHQNWCASMRNQLRTIAERTA